MTLLGAVAEMERKFICERQQTEIEAAKAKGVLKAVSRPSRSRGYVRCGPLGMARAPSRRLSGLAG